MKKFLTGLLLCLGISASLIAQEYRHICKIGFSMEEKEGFFYYKKESTDLLDSIVRKMDDCESYLDLELTLNRVVVDCLEESKILDFENTTEFHFDTDDKEFLELNLIGADCEPEELLENLEKPIGLKIYKTGDFGCQIPDPDRRQLADTLPISLTIPEIINTESVFLKVFAGKKLVVGKSYEIDFKELSEECVSNIKYIFTIESMENGRVYFITEGGGEYENWEIEENEDGDEVIVERRGSGGKRIVTLTGRGSFGIDPFEHELDLNFDLKKKDAVPNSSDHLKLSFTVTSVKI